MRFIIVEKYKFARIGANGEPIERPSVCWQRSPLKVNVIHFVQYKNNWLILYFDNKLFGVVNITFVASSITKSSGIDGNMLSMSSDIIKEFLLYHCFQNF